MSTRSEIRFVEKGKLKKCIYHHHDGYPSHIVADIKLVGAHPNIMDNIAKAHGTQNTGCAYPKSMSRHQDDIEYSYEVDISSERKIRGFKPMPKIDKITIFEHRTKVKPDGSFEFNKPKNKSIVFSGDVNDAYSKFVERGET